MPKTKKKQTKKSRFMGCKDQNSVTGDFPITNC